jgi:hypothetical protein
MKNEIELEVEITSKTLELIYAATAYTLAGAAAKKFSNQREGKFNRFLTADKQGNGKCFLVYFESDLKANVMTYDEALAIPVLANKCKEIWND